MENYSGYWTGEMRGTNLGSFVFELKQEGQSIQGNAKFQEPALGQYEYSIRGIAGTEVSLDLTPAANPSKLILGRIKAVARLQEDGKLVGKWSSTVGAEGVFTARREISEVSPNAPPVSQATTSKSEQVRFKRELNKLQREDLYKVYRQMIEVVVNAFRGGGDEPDRFRAAHTYLTGFKPGPLPLPQWFRTTETLRQMVDFLRKEVGADDLRAANAFINREFTAFRKMVEPPEAFTREKDPESLKSDAPRTATDVSPFDPATAVSRFLPGIANDGVDGDPYIDIKADVQSIARVMCMQQIKPPLSIALFGNWGSGKSFFMRQLRKEVGKITESPDAGSNNKPFYKDIIQIEFNAWHYVEANLWASLVSHIFENLKSPGERDELKQQKEQEALLEKLGSAQKQKEDAQKKLEEAKQKEEVAQKELAQKEAERQEKLHTLEEVKANDLLKAVLTEREKDIKTNVTDVQTKLGLQGAVNTLEDAGKALAEAKEIGGDIAKFIRTFISAPGRGKRLAFVLLSLGAVVVIPAVFTVIAGLNEWKPWTDALKWVATIVGAASALIKPLHETTRNFCSVLEKLRAASLRFDAVVKEKTQAQDSAVQTARTEVAAAARAVAKAKDNVREAEGAIAAAEEALAKASPRGLLNAFIEERAASDDYRKNLGILALVRRDFEKLSDLLKGVRGDLNAIEYKNLPRIDRIILYIDDLDRCPPKQVVEVLQAIHLLLAFELFVVVVGVDPRWISHSLKKHYPELLGNDPNTMSIRSQQNGKNGSTNSESDSASHDTARPLDYLEKIFQIPFWIKPIGGRETGNLINGLLTPDLLRPANSPEQNEETQPAPDSQVDPTIRAQNDPDKSTAQVLDTAGKSSESEAGFAGTILSEAEVKFMSDLKRLAGSTPRAIKRYVNIYRLLRARVSKIRVEEFEGKAGEPREFEAVMYLLALFNTAPVLAQKFCKELEKFKEAEELEQAKKGEQRNSSSKQRLNARLTDVVTKMKQGGDFTSIEQALIGALENYAKEFDSMERVFTESRPPTDPPTIDAFCRWHPVVSRYSFVGESARNSESELPAKS